jgi:hypothetical protein
MHDGGHGRAAPDVADPLYAVPPDEFVAARDALAKQLRADGDKAAAAVVAKLRRPTPVAGALNRVVREQPALVEGAVSAGAMLQAATDAALEGDASELRAATADDRAATKALSEAVAAVLATSPAEVAQRVTATVRAASASPEVAAVLAAGRLAADLEPAGFGLPDADGAPATPADELAPRRQARADKAEQERQQREDEERRARQRRRAAHEQRVTRLEAKAERLAGVAREAEQAAAEARAAADAIAAELEATRAEDPEAD